MKKKKFSREKKGFVFTLIALLLFSSLFILTSAYLKRNTQTQSFISQAVYSNRIKFIRETVVSDFYSIMDISLGEITHKNNAVIVRFNNFSWIGANTPYQQRLDTYQQFIETTYANAINAKLRLQNFYPEFYLYPYNSIFRIAEDRFYFYSTQVTALKNISISIIANSTDVLSLSLPTNDTGNPLVNVSVLIYDNQSMIIVNKTFQLSPYEENQSIFIVFNQSTTPNLTVEYGKHRDIRFYGNDILTNGTLYVRSYGLNSKITSLSFALNDTNEKVVLKTIATLAID